MPINLAQRLESLSGYRHSNTTGLSCGLLCSEATGRASLRVKPESLNDPQERPFVPGTCRATITLLLGNKGHVPPV